MLMCLSAIYQTSAYETYTLIKSQNIFFQINAERLTTISKWTHLCSNITQYLTTYPKFSCMCGACVIILKRQFANYQNMNLITCSCPQYYKNIDNSQCPSPGCLDFIQFMKTYKRQYNNPYTMTPDDQLLWGFFEEEDFVIGPNFSGIADNY